MKYLKMNLNKKRIRKKDPRIRRVRVHWSVNAIYKLIKAVEKYECLWNVASRQYKHRDATKGSWSKIAEELQVSVQDANVKWNSLRVTYRSALKNQMYTKKTPTLPYFEAMSFLQPTLTIENQEQAEALEPPCSPLPSEQSIKLETGIFNASSPSVSPKLNGDDLDVEELSDITNSFSAGTLPTNVVDRDSWGIIGDFIASNGRKWENEYPLLAVQYQTELYGLVYKMQQKVMTKKTQESANLHRIKLELNS